MRIIDVISHPNVMDDELVGREPQGGNGNFRMGSNLIVNESQAAVFVREGQALDVLGPGKHTLSTGNLPVLSSLIGMVTNGGNPFTCDVYFVNQKDLPQVTWGTNPPIVMYTPGRSPGFSLLRTHGIVDISVEDPLRFVKQYAMGKQMVRLGDLQIRIQTMLNSLLTNLLSKQKIANIQDANAMLDQLNSGSLAVSSDEFVALGMKIKQFTANGFDAKPLTSDDIRTYGSLDDYERSKRLDIAQDAANNQGTGGGLVGAGLGLGIGQSLSGSMDPNQKAMQDQMAQQQMMMNQMMMQMMQNNMPKQPAAAPTPAAPVNTNPTTKEDIQALLDNLDMKLAGGEINQDIYNKLTAKWEARLKELGG